MDIFIINQLIFQYFQKPPTHAPPLTSHFSLFTFHLWLSVDPLSDKYPGVSPYVYCADNPVRLVDVDGREISGPDDPPHNKQNIQGRIESATYKVTDVGHSFAKGLASSMPILSTVNDIHILVKGENMFGDKATDTDKIWAKASLTTLGAGSAIRFVGKTTVRIGRKVFEGASKATDYVGKVLDFGSGVSTTINDMKNNNNGK